MKKKKDVQLRLLLNAVAGLLSDLSTAQAETASWSSVDRSLPSPIQKKAPLRLANPPSVQLQITLSAKNYEDLNALKDCLGFATVQEIVVSAIEEGASILAKKRCDALLAATVS